MAAHAYWTGNLQISLVSFPVRLFTALSSSSHVTFNQLHGIEGCYRRIRYHKFCPEHGEVPGDEIVKGYAYEKDRYVVMDDEDFKRVKLPTTRTIEIVQFIRSEELDPILLDSPYYMTPDKNGEKAFQVVHEALRRARKLGIGRVTFSGRERIVALRPQENGFRLTTLRYAAEIRDAEEYFEEIRKAKPDDAQLKLARQLIDNLSEPFKPERFVDRYQEALMEVINAKVAGEEPVVVEEPSAPKVINLMKALQKSLAEAKSQKKPPAASVKKTTKAKRKKGA